MRDQLELAINEAVSERYAELSVQLEGPGRVEHFMGREHVVVPATLVRAKVLNNNLGRTFLPPDELTTAWADAANGAPVITDHPTSRGRPITARSPSVLNARGVGFLFGVHVETDALKGDVYLDPARAEHVEGLQPVLDKLAANETVELSTGFPLRALEETPGVHNGEEYDRVLRPAGFDHLAVFADKVGACSIADGCGMGVNCDGTSCSCGSSPAGILERFSGAIAAVFGRRRAREIEVLAAAENESDEDRRHLLRMELRERFIPANAEDVWLWIEAVFSEDGRVVYEIDGGENAGLYEVDFEIDEGSVSFGEPAEVRRVTTYEPVANGAGASPIEGSTMNRAQLIAHLAEASPLTAEQLEQLSDAQLAALHEADSDASADGSTDAADPAPEQAAANDRAVAELLQEVTSRLERIENATAPAVAEQERTRSELVDRLAANDRVKAAGYTEDSLKTKSLAELDQIASLARVESYAGRGGPAPAADNEAPRFAAPTYPEPARNGAEKEGSDR